MRAHLTAAFALAIGLAASFAGAQPLPAELPGDATAPPAPAPITISYVDGRVDVARPDGVVAAAAPDILDEDDRLVTGEGRAELLLDDGTVVHVDRETDIRIDRAVRLRLVSGRLVVHTPAELEPVVVASPAGLIRLATRGVYDLRADDLRGDTTIAVLDGTAALGDGDRALRVEAGDALSVNPRDLRSSRTHTAGPDAFLDWSRRRIGATTTDLDLALPAPIRPWAADLAMHGQWSTLPQFGTVWFPSAGPSWRPYFYGSWRFTRHGWTWIDAERWAWPVHHYGRWGRHASRGWYWMPQRTWGPAWVGWAVASQHVAWAPLGWNRRPLVDFTSGLRNGPAGPFASTWSILPRRSFGQRGPVYRDLEDPQRLPGPVLGGFVSQMVGPRGPADPADRYRVGGRRPPYNPPPSSRGRYGAPPIAYQPSAAPSRENVPVDRHRRRPMDAPPVDPAPVVMPRSWSTAPETAPREGGRRERPGERGSGVPEAFAPGGEAPIARPSPAPRPAPPSSGAAERPRSPGWSAPQSQPHGTGSRPGAGEARPHSGGARRAPQGGGEGARSNGGGGGAGRGQARPRG